MKVLQEPWVVLRQDIPPYYIRIPNTRKAIPFSVHPCPSNPTLHQYILRESATHTQQTGAHLLQLPALPASPHLPNTVGQSTHPVTSREEF